MAEALLWPTPPPEASVDDDPEQNESYAPPPVVPAPARTFNLFHYINTTSLRNSMADVEPDPEDPDVQRLVANRNFVIRTLVYIHLCSALVACGLIVWTVVGYEIRLYEHQRSPSQCLLLFWLVRMLVNVCLNVWAIRYHCHNLPDPKAWLFCMKLYNAGSILWLVSAVWYTMLYPRETLWSFSCRMCYFMIWMTILGYFSPRMALDLCTLFLSLIVFGLIRIRAQGSLTPGLTRKMMAKLEVDRFENVAERIKNGETRAMSPGCSRADTPNESGDAGMAVPIPVGESADSKNASAAPTPRPAATNAVAVLDRLCAICIVEITDREKIYVMPCDIRHLFHRDCLKKWFKRSRICPICRVNVADVIRKDNAKLQLGTTVL
ncbi:zinc C3HC4 type RING finger domain-containing protein [Babesia ovata]|uniref:RING-type E3 ubiquitin transferase n=1 Tax=Babesia ovata TaxID=189622 RepID=A0A2H6KCW4_9APIC|nr:zinc C3HC4 type RING finger domain-containing protein [Babesia ovata]GBE60840.1 zinc C3HC4 type RING finger domain-containing protein [Babesia ovata]